LKFNFNKSSFILNGAKRAPGLEITALSNGSKKIPIVSIF
jgi:hypothetical protein